MANVVQNHHKPRFVTLVKSLSPVYSLEYQLEALTN
nr:MAG TPA: hypothetical protein [Caudoviricetes sp.]